MAQDPGERWNRTEGVLIAPGTTPEAVAALLEGQRVVARLEWYPTTPHLVGLTLACDAEGRVAVTPPSRGGVVPGPGTSELTESLARELGAAVTIGPASFDALPDGADLPGGGPTASEAARTVVVSPLSAYTVPLQATLLDRPLAVASVPGLDRRVVMHGGEGPSLGAFGWDEDSLPALVLTVDGGDMTAQVVTTTEGEPDAVYSWAMESRYVHGGVEEPGPALTTFVEELLEDRTDAATIAAAVPGADEEAVAAAVAAHGLDGMLALVEALGLPAFVGQVLTGRLAPAEVPGAVVHEPRGLSNAVGRSVGMMLQDPAAPGAGAARTYRHLVTDSPWLVRGALVLEAALGGALVGAAVRRRRATGTVPGWLLAAGTVVLVDCVAQASVASWVRHRELRRRADEEMALVAEELGA